MSRGPALGSGSSAAATIIGGATGDQTKGLTFREDINPNGAGNISTVMIPTSLAKIDKHLPVVRRKDIMEAYAGLSNSARQALLTIVDKEFVEQLDRCQKVAWRVHLSPDRRGAERKYPRLTKLFEPTNHNVLPGFGTPSQSTRSGQFKDGYMLLEDDLVSSINGEKDALQPCMKALMDHTLFDFIDERCEDFLRNAKRNRSRLVTRKELWYRLFDGLDSGSVRYADLDASLAQALEFRILSEYHKDRFASLQRRHQESAQQQQQESSPFLGGPQSSRFLNSIPFESVASRSFVDLEAGEQGEAVKEAAQPSKAAKKRKKRQAKKAATAKSEGVVTKAKGSNSNGEAKQLNKTGAVVNSSTVSTIVSPGGSSSSISRSRSPSEASSSSSSSTDSLITPVQESTLVRAKTAIESLAMKAPIVVVPSGVDDDEEDDDDGEWQTVGKSKSNNRSSLLSAEQKKQQSSKGPSTRGKAAAVGPRTAKDTSNGSAPKTTSKVRSVEPARRTNGEIEAALKRETSVKVKRTFYEFYVPDSTDLFSVARQQLGLRSSEAPF